MGPTQPKLSCRTRSRSRKSLAGSMMRLKMKWLPRSRRSSARTRNVKSRLWLCSRSAPKREGAINHALRALPRTASSGRSNQRVSRGTTSHSTQSSCEIRESAKNASFVVIGSLPSTYIASISESAMLAIKNGYYCNGTHGEIAIGRVAHVNSGLWWILLCAYTKSTKDNFLAESPYCHRAMRLILKLLLFEGFDMSPALLCADGCSMIHHTMGIYGYPIEIQALFFMALRCALSLMKDSNDDFRFKRIKALRYRLHSYYWLDFQRLNDTYRYKTEEYPQTALYKFNVIPESIPDWIFDFMPSRGGYFIGNPSPARMDFRWFCLVNFIAILSSLATAEQCEAILDLVEERWEELIGEMPLKICYPAMESEECQIVTGCDPKNTIWSYHNGGSWPVLLWLLVALSVKLVRTYIARRAVDLIERRLERHDFPDWIFDFMPSRGGYFIGNVSPARMDFRWFCLVNFIAILSSLATAEQSEAILDLVEERWEELIGEMPLKICYPAMESEECQIVTGCDPKNTRWSYHNGGSWLVLLLLLVAVKVKLGRSHIAQRAVDLMERRLAKDDYPEYYDGKAGRYIWKQARKLQTWSVAGYLVAKMLLDDPSILRAVSLEDDGHIREPVLKCSNSCPCLVTAHSTTSTG